MTTPPINYPQFRKYKNEKTYFKIFSGNEWEEIQLIGSQYKVQQYKVSIFPDRNFLHDLTFEYQNNWQKIEEEEYKEVLKKATN